MGRSGSCFFWCFFTRTGFHFAYKRFNAALVGAKTRMKRPERREEKMKKVLWFWGASLAATLACGAAGAEDRFSLDRFGGMEAPRVVPQPKSKQSPAATACATGNGQVALDLRITACTSLIESGQWKGKDIGWAYANRCAVYSAQGRDDKALADCVHAISLDPETVIPYQIR